MISDSPLGDYDMEERSLKSTSVDKVLEILRKSLL